MGLERRVDWYVTGNSVWDMKTGHQKKWGHGENYNALVHAIKNARPGDKIGFIGKHRGFRS